MQFKRFKFEVFFYETSFWTYSHERDRRMYRMTDGRTTPVHNTAPCWTGPGRVIRVITGRHVKYHSLKNNIKDTDYFTIVTAKCRRLLNRKCVFVC